MSSAPLIAQKYAKALHGLVHQKGNDKTAQTQLVTLAAAVASDAKVQEYFASPLVPPDQKKNALKASLEGKGLLEEISNLLIVMADRNRLGLIGEVSHAYQELLDAEQGLIRGTVKSSRPLTAEAIAEIEGKISTAMKRKVALSFQEDPSVMGGVVAEVGGWTFDDSIQTHLHKLNDLLNRSAQ